MQGMLRPKTRVKMDSRLTLPRNHYRTARNSKPLEVIGTYDPVPKKDSYDTSGKLHKDIRLDIDRAKYWIGVGAQPTDTVWRFLSMVRTLPQTTALVKGGLC